MLGDDVSAILPALRAQAESQMHDRVRIFDPGAEPELDEETGLYPESPVAVYEGKARIRLPRAWGNEVDEQGASITVQPATVSVPVDGTASIRKGHIVELLASRHDPDSVGFKVRVTEVHCQTHSTARRLGVELES